MYKIFIQISFFFLFSFGDAATIHTNRWVASKQVGLYRWNKFRTWKEISDPDLIGLITLCIFVGTVIFCLEAPEFLRVNMSKAISIMGASAPESIHAKIGT